MKFLIPLLIIFSAKSFAASGSGNVSSVSATCGAPYNTSSTYSGIPQQLVPVSDLASVITLSGYNSSTTGGRYYGFYSMNQASGSGSTLYQVPNGKTLYIAGVVLGVGSGGNAINLGWGTAAIASEGTSSAPTGENNYSPSSTIYPIVSPIASTSGFAFHPILTSFPANSYPFWKAGGSTSYYVYMCGYLK